ncbi:MAG: hypothetical protein A3B74_02310 [Candidatus Kerfeldbacteria bacterium RIFCSPHIGHO2_02_FULL_42_14]|uniref:Peptidase A2 domain-containing protein n=1 Tax=Candidatus Kerfeldbacteria bacterium RIFCSPHIGHO2_02_FULL_42_14 TaxID=1798540 RepID=A0A1G2ARQ2_9BACT|nr:MAG: hypothetical protein A3B74_02310 [Candidatus Kerfeldbacteria bacterium RIFCSPHIGHO2_02_FULL_42_14]OGY80382.1 MAG: hypothetical protein A3E60_04930 [Candidatus Kerfeldbacteria bacterium RIFCSPHIGHO2_12_FULL_42_13]OGY83811.1 MAG: hypothetical protein A3I91_04455 [Candidatus Kerfeldbacteria bacterium RIFCSPLOWO2_02_FULL_42_19]OGY87122.1 MAG: hypothetical protein A3G01_04555 [Candidatus Kerfeldbacteria bacterium RIFCSPLOWO2_12_FULL_43_9]
MKFSYFKFPLSARSEFFGSSILKPIIPIELVGEADAFRYDALIDSGADFCIFDATIGETLGFDVRSGKVERFGGIQEAYASSAYFQEITMVIGGWKYRTTVGFSYDIARHGYGILGQKGFFDIFTVKFNYSKEEIELKESMKSQ